MTTLTPGKADLRTLRKIAREGMPFTLDPACRAGVDASRNVVENILGKDEPVYGINTGFGQLATTRIPPDKLAELQRNLILSHATGTGEMLGDKTVRLILTLKILGLARGCSGVRWEIIDRLKKFLDFSLLPQIPAKGSVGASGDLNEDISIKAVPLRDGSAHQAGIHSRANPYGPGQRDSAGAGQVVRISDAGHVRCRGRQACRG